MKEGKVKEAEAVLDRALKALGLDPNARPQPAKTDPPKADAASGRERGPKGQSDGRATPGPARLGESGTAGSPLQGLIVYCGHHEPGQPQIFTRRRQ